jgi:glutaredoxin
MTPYFRGLFLLLTLAATLVPAPAHSGSELYNRVSTLRKGVVWAAFFSSTGCPMCDNVKTLMAELMKKYPFRFRQFDIDKPSDYEIFERLESIHSEESFSVPLILIGESILIGERQIVRKLEGTIRSLSRSGGSPLPYLGPSVSSDAADHFSDSSRRLRESDGRPPTIWEEWAKVKAFFRWLF